ncbi:hypothetical protein E4U28_005114 [Claviceps purpurea]|nr:hypothetical protein E4U28_005114 [Claviceps purpurea]
MSQNNQQNDRLYDRTPGWRPSSAKLIYSIRQGPAQPLALFLGDYNALCTRAGPFAPTGPARIEIQKAALNEFIRSAATIRGFRSDLDWDAYSQGLIELATELEQLAGGGIRARAGAQGIVVAQEEGEGLSWTLPEAIDELSIAGGEILREEAPSRVRSTTHSTQKRRFKYRTTSMLELSQKRTNDIGEAPPGDTWISPTETCALLQSLNVNAFTSTLPRSPIHSH